MRQIPQVTTTTPGPERRVRGSLLSLLGMLALLAGLHCRRETTALDWPYPGHDLANTRYAPQPSSRLRANWQFSRVWEAEDFQPEEFELNPVTKAATRRLLVADIGPMAGDEIALDVDGFSGILDNHGVLIRQLSPVEQNISVGALPNRKAVLVACSLDVVNVYSSLAPEQRAAPLLHVRTAAPASEAWLITVPRYTGTDPHRAAHPVSRLITVEPGRFVTALDGVQAVTTTVVGYDPDREDTGTPAPLWRYETGASMCHVWAIADVNGDSEPEIIVGTYGYEHGISVNGIADTGKAYVLCFSDQGALLWQAEFGRHPHLYTQALAVDLDGDSVREVVVACGSWDREFGCLRVLDGRTGKCRARFPADDPTGYAFTGIAAGDIDSDGRPEICAVSSGKSARVWVLRFVPGSNRLETVARREYPGAITESFVNAGLLAICNFGASRQPDLLVTLSHETQIDDDPYFYPSRISGAQLTLLDKDLSEIRTIPLPGALKCAAVTGLQNQSRHGILALTDRLEYYEPK
jgi:hypothetical protein